MTSTDPITAQATRSFGDYLQGAVYSLDRHDGQLMSLLGAGYFSEVVNPNLTSTPFTYVAGERVEKEEVVTGGAMGTEPVADPADRQRARPRARVARSTRNRESGEGVRAPEDGSIG